MDGQEEARGSTAQEPKSNLLGGSKVKRRTKKHENPGSDDRLEPQKQKTMKKEPARKSRTRNKEEKPDYYQSQIMDGKDGSMASQALKKEVPDGEKVKRRKRKDENIESDPDKKQKSKSKVSTKKVQKPDTDTATDTKPETEEFQNETYNTKKKIVKKPKNTKKVKEEEDVSETAPRPLHPSVGSHKFVGAHVSIQGGLWNAALEAKRIGAKAFGLFLRSQRSWNSKPLDEEVAEKFRRTCDDLGFGSRYILPHSPYLMNLGSPKPVLENMSCQGSTVGGRFEELRGIIDHINDKSRIGVCLDTCHAFAAGHNLSEKTGLQNMLDEFDKIVGLSYLKALHLNDSKGEVGCRLDRHENIGRGYIGVEGFRKVMNEPRFNEIPMILETPASSGFEDFSTEIDLLYSLCE
ncbi:hypothetical protein GDO81_018119 [Engystomops pustulosus]|uniref:Xylose isomerase-like TIM barrel domain-containing protein n=1 Tax=Engystomops pustulosus TaxID=76066 RepID=A0AAV7A4S5_ENGPU|nr:hypothetical protein GDO81_018119 [Engystomops pustulosus]KAG8556577.1 hypothetical protein GDO81_018119 [Engystomops pustulosus]